jgi:hypothetical protein
MPPEAEEATGSVMEFTYFTLMQSLRIFTASRNPQCVTVMIKSIGLKFFYPLKKYQQI